VQNYLGVPCFPLPSPTAGQAIRCNLLFSPNAKSNKRIFASILNAFVFKIIIKKLTFAFERSVIFEKN
jgi:hypothetical protein